MNTFVSRIFFAILLIDSGLIYMYFNTCIAIKIYRLVMLLGVHYLLSAQVSPKGMDIHDNFIYMWFTHFKLVFRSLWTLNGSNQAIFENINNCGSSVFTCTRHVVIM